MSASVRPAGPARRRLLPALVLGLLLCLGAGACGLQPQDEPQPIPPGRLPSGLGGASGTDRPTGLPTERTSPSLLPGLSSVP